MLRKRLHFILIITLICIFAAFLGGCVTEQSIEEFAKPNSLVRLVNASPDAANATIQIIDRDSVTAVVNTTVAYGNSSAYFTVPSGNRIIYVTSGSVKKTFTVTMASDLQYSIVMRNPVASLTLASVKERYTYNDEAAKLASGKAQVRFLNEIYGGPAIKVKAGTDSVSSITAASLGAYLLVDAGKSYTFAVSNASTNAAIGNCPALSAATNTRYTIVVFGSTDSTGVKNFSAKLLTDDNK